MFKWTLATGETVVAVPFDPNPNLDAAGAGLSIIFEAGQPGAYVAYMDYGVWVHKGAHVRPGDYLALENNGHTRVIPRDELAAASPANENARRWLRVLAERELPGPPECGEKQLELMVPRG